jgi:hypothetical protein
VYARTVETAELEFGVSGSLWRDALVFYDRATGSLWSQVTGRSIQGPMKGKTLEHVFSVVTTLGDWKRAHPNTLVLKQPSRVGNPYQRYESSPDQMGVLGTPNPDSRLPGKEVVLGVRMGEAQSAYPLRRLRKKPILNDVLGGEPVLILLDTSGESGRAFSRRTEGKVLTFEPVDKGLFSLLQDKDTGSLWERSTGRAVQGPRKGSRLDPLVSLRAYWFAWRSFFPSSELREEE